MSDRCRKIFTDPSRTGPARPGFLVDVARALGSPGTEGHCRRPGEELLASGASFCSSPGDTYPTLSLLNFARNGVAFVSEKSELSGAGKDRLDAPRAPRESQYHLGAGPCWARPGWNRDSTGPCLKREEHHRRNAWPKHIKKAWAGDAIFPRRRALGICF